MKFVINRIGDLCEKITDGSHFSPEDDPLGNYPMYSVKDMEYSGFTNDDCKMIGQDVFEKLAKSDCRPLKDDILIAKDGSYLKYVFKVEEDMDACILSSIAILRPDTNIIDPDYFVFLLRSQSIKSAMANYVSGSALPRIILADFKKMKIKMIQDVQEQRKVAAILKKYDLLINNNINRIAQLEKIAYTIYKEWFLRKRSPYEFRKLDWEEMRLGDVCDFIGRGISPDYVEEDGRIVLNQKCVRNGQVSFEPARLTSYKKKISDDKILKYGDTLVNSTGTGTLGRTAIYRRKQNNVTVDSHVTIVRALDIKYAYIIGFFLKSQEKQIENYGKGSTNQIELSANDLRRMKLDLCVNDIILEDFNSIISRIYDELGYIESQNDILIKKRDLLLPRLLNGKITV